MVLVLYPVKVVTFSNRKTLGRDGIRWWWQIISQTEKSYDIFILVSHTWEKFIKTKYDQKDPQGKSGESSKMYKEYTET